MDKIRRLNDKLTIELKNFQKKYEELQERHYLGLPENDLLSKQFVQEYEVAERQIKDLLDTSGIEKQLSESNALSRLFVGAFLPGIQTFLTKEIADRKMQIDATKAMLETLEYRSYHRSVEIPAALNIAFGNGFHSDGGTQLINDPPCRKKKRFFDKATDRVAIYQFMNRSFLEENPSAVIETVLAETVDSSLRKLARRLVLLRDELWECNLSRVHEFSVKFRANIESSRKHVVNLANFVETNPDHIAHVHKRINQTFRCFFNMHATVANLKNERQRRHTKILRDQLARDEREIKKLADKFRLFQSKVVIRENFRGRYSSDHFDDQGEVSDEDCEVEPVDERRDGDNLDAQYDANLAAETMLQETAADLDPLIALSGDEWDSPKSVADISQANHSEVHRTVEDVLDRKDIDFQYAQQELIQLGLECKAVRADELRAGESIGAGSFSVVRVTTVKTSNKKVAIKLIKETARFPFSSLVNEAIIWGSLEHSNILKLEGYAVIDRGQDYGPTLGLVSAECACGSLASYVTNEGEHLTLKKKFELLRDVAAGLRYLHERRPLKIIHGDLRAANVLIDSRRNARLTDFGISPSFDNEAKLDPAQTVTNVRWLAYELVDLPVWEARKKLNEHTDMFAFGCVMHEVLTKWPPFHSDADDVIVTAKKNKDLPPRPDHVHRDIWDSMITFWNIKPKTRPTAETAHAMMDEIVENQL